MHPGCPLGECSLSQLNASLSRLSDSLLHFFGGMAVNDHFSGFICRVHGYKRHGRPFLLRLGSPTLYEIRCISYSIVLKLAKEDSERPEARSEMSIENISDISLHIFLPAQ